MRETFSERGASERASERERERERENRREIKILYDAKIEKRNTGTREGARG